MFEAKETAITTLALSGDTLVERNPARLYLACLTAKGRRSMGCRLVTIARLYGHQDLDSVPWHLMRYEHALAVRTHFLNRGLAPKTINTALCAMSGVARAAWNLGLMSTDDFMRVRHVKKVSGSRLPPGRALTQDELARLFDACARDKNPSRGARDAAILGIYAGAGVRRDEGVAVDLRDYDPETGALRVVGKGNKERLVYVAGGAKRALDDWVELRGRAEGPLLTSTHRRGTIYNRRLAGTAVYETVRHRARQAAIQRFTPHDLRRTFISDLLDAGADLVSVSKLAGHDDPNTTARYDRRGERAKMKAASLSRVPYGMVEHSEQQ
jgi:integrase